MILTFPATRRLSAQLWEFTPTRIVCGWLLVFGGWIPAIFLRGVADDTSIPHQRDSVLTVERWFGLGLTPTERLQNVLFTGEAQPWDWFFMLTHAAWFVVPELVIVYVLWKHPRLFSDVALVRLGVIYASIGIHFLLPTEPPWMAIDVARIMDLGWKGAENADTNALAAMPSHHVAAVAALGFWLYKVKLLAWPMLTFAALTCLSVVYLGEHYVADVIAGLLLAYIVVLLTRPIARTDT